MLNSDLFAQLQHLSRIEKFRVIQFLIAELTKEEEANSTEAAAAIVHAVHTSEAGASQLMQLLETEEIVRQQAQNA